MYPNVFVFAQKRTMNSAVKNNESQAVVVARLVELQCLSNLATLMYATSIPTIGLLLFLAAKYIVCLGGNVNKF